MRSLYSWEELDSQYADPPPTWKRAEGVIREELGLEEEHAPWYDARDGDGDVVEIKSCAYEYEDGRIGRFVIWESQLFELVNQGRVAFLVYVPDGTHRVIATHVMDPLPLRSEGTVKRTDHTTMGYQPQRWIPWTDVIPLDAVKFGCRRYFIDNYSDEVVEETMFMNST